MAFQRRLDLFARTNVQSTDKIALVSGTNERDRTGIIDATDFPFAGSPAEGVATPKTLDAGDSGVLQNVTADAGVVTLPATVVGLTFIIRNAGADGTVLVTVSPAAADKIIGNGVTGTDDKDILNTKLTALKGDYVVLVGDGVDGWMVQDIKGIWAFEA